MNDPAERPGPHEGYDGKKYFGLLVQMLSFGVALYRWVWKPRREIHELKLIDALNKEHERQKEAEILLKEVEYQLIERQRIYCSFLLPKEQRLELEKKLLLKANSPVGKNLGLEEGFKKIFEYDTYCAEPQNSDSTKNGKLMWLYLKYWNKQVELQKYERLKNSMQ